MYSMRLLHLLIEHLRSRGIILITTPPIAPISEQTMTMDLLLKLPDEVRRKLSDYRGTVDDHKAARTKSEDSWLILKQFVKKELNNRPNSEKEYWKRAEAAAWFGDETGALRGLPMRTVYGVYVAPVYAHERDYHFQRVFGEHGYGG